MLAADQGRDFALQVSHAGFPRVAVDDFLQPSFRELQLFAFLHPVLCCLLGDQVLAGDVDLLFAGVSGKFDDLHTVRARVPDGIIQLAVAMKMIFDKMNGTSR